MIYPSVSPKAPRLNIIQIPSQELKVISTDVGHMNSILEKQFLCRRNDLEALKKLISDSFESYEEIDQSEAFCKVKKNFTIENANQQISDAINSLTI